MKKKIMVLLIFLLIIGVVSAVVFETVDDREKFRITMINQEPDPVSPGNMVDVRFRVENLRTVVAEDVEVKLETKGPISHYSSGDKIQSIGTLAPGQANDNGVRVKWKLRVSPSAVEGENEIEFYYRFGDGAWVKYTDFTIDVRTADAVLAINEIEASEERMEPGDEVDITFKLENLADSVLKDIRLKLELYHTLGSGTTAVNTELPFAPSGSGNEKTFERIDPGKTADVGFKLFIDADAESKVYKVPYTLTYMDEVGTNFSRAGYVGLKVDAELDVSISLDDTNILSGGDKGTIDVKFVNKGFSDIKFVNIILTETQDYEILTNEEVYLGNIDSDDFDSAEFDLLMKESAEGVVKLPIKVEYRSSNGEMYSDEIFLELKLFSGEELKERSGKNGNAWVGIIIVIVIVIAGIVIWRWRKRRRR